MKHEINPLIKKFWEDQGFVIKPRADNPELVESMMWDSWKDDVFIRCIATTIPYLNFYRYYYNGDQYNENEMLLLCKVIGKNLQAFL